MTNSSLSLKTAIDKLSGAKVICVGDVMLDKFVYGEIERISPEAPIPVPVSYTHLTLPTILRV